MQLNPINLGPTQWANTGQTLGSLGDTFNTAYNAAQKQQTMAQLGQLDLSKPEDQVKAQKLALASGDLGSAAKIMEMAGLVRQQQQQADAMKLWASPTGGAPQQPTQPLGATTVLEPAAKAISSVESSGRYDALGPVTPTGDRAYGKYQVMGANVGPWTEQYVGRRMAPQEFAASPEAQEAVFKGEFGRLSQKYGPEGASRAWFAGEGGMNDMKRKDQLGTSVADYSRRFQAAGGAPPVQMAQDGRVQSDAPAQGAQPAQGFAVSQGGNGLPPNDPRPDISNQQLQQIMVFGTPALKEQAKMILERRLRYSDDNTPLKTENMRLQNQKLQREADTPTGPASWQEYQLAKKDGYSGSYLEFQKEVSSAKSQKETVQESNTAREKEAERLGLQGEDRKNYILNGKIPAGAEKLTNDQANAGLYADRMRAANAIIADPKTIAAAQSFPQKGMAAIPGAGNFLVSADYQRADQAQRDFLNAILRRESGAAISSSEFENGRKQYFPQPGDAPAVLEQKMRNRQLAIDGISRAGGPTYAKDNPPGTTQADKPAQAAKPIGNFMRDAKRAPDGNVYVPDPNRPGKYLMVQP